VIHQGVRDVSRTVPLVATGDVARGGLIVRLRTATALLLDQALGRGDDETDRPNGRMTRTQGLFISLEGIDGSGKSTQSRGLAEAMRGWGRDPVLTREPGGAPGAEDIRRLLVEGDPARWSPETEILLFTAARRDHLERTIRPALAMRAGRHHRPLRGFHPRLPGRHARRSARAGRHDP
jgi:hypothetical protein